MTKTKPKPKFQIAVLDDKLTLVGYKEVTSLGDDDVDVGMECDLPVDGTYKYDPQEKTFVPLGHGFGKPKRAPVPDSLVLYILASKMKNPPQEIRDWCGWYEENLAQQHEELIRKGT